MRSKSIFSPVCWDEAVIRENISTFTRISVKKKRDPC